MGILTNNENKTVFLKESSDTINFIEKMENLKKDAEGELFNEIDKQIKLANYGLQGENSIIYELKSSGLDMYVLHDIYLEIEDLSAQIDFIVVTRKRIYVLECKNLIGNIEIDNTGAFTRIYEYGGRKIKEGIYSPITQNERHLRVIKEVRKASKSGFITKKIFENNFDDNYKSVVVLANSKNYVNVKYAKKEIRDKVVRLDQLIDYIKKSDDEFGGTSMSKSRMQDVANFFLQNNKEGHSNYADKYQKLLEQSRELSGCEDSSTEQIKEQSVNDRSSDCVKRLKEFRLEQSKKEGVKPYYIFTDAQMQDVVKSLPNTKEELQRISGFGKVKVEKYGDEILKLLADYR